MKKIITFILLITFIATFLPFNAIAYAGEKAKEQITIGLNSKVKNKIEVPAQRENNNMEQPVTVRYSQVDLTNENIEDFIYGHSVYYSILKKMNKLDLLDEVLKTNKKIIPEKIKKEEKTEKEIKIEELVAQLQKIEALNEKIEYSVAETDEFIDTSELDFEEEEQEVNNIEEDEIAEEQSQEKEDTSEERESIDEQALISEEADQLEDSVNIETTEKEEQIEQFQEDEVTDNNTEEESEEESDEEDNNTEIDQEAIEESEETAELTKEDEESVLEEEQEEIVTETQEDEITDNNTEEESDEEDNNTEIDQEAIEKSEETSELTKEDEEPALEEQEEIVTETQEDEVTDNNTEEESDEEENTEINQEAIEESEGTAELTKEDEEPALEEEQEETKPDIQSVEDEEITQEEIFSKDEVKEKISEKLKGKNFTKEFKTDRYIVKYKDGQEDEGRNKANTALEEKAVKLKTNNSKNFDIFGTTDKATPAEFVYELIKQKADVEIEYIQPDYEISLASQDTFYDAQWGLFNQIEENDETRIDADVVGAWDIADGNGVVIAVIDTEIDTSHEDLAENIWINSSEVSDNGIDDDENGFVDDVNGWNFVDGNNTIQGNEMHGTNVAGIIGAVKDNNKGIAGVAPQVKIMPLKAFANGTAYTSDIIEAIEYAELMGVKIVNCSWGMSTSNPALEEAMGNSSMLFVCASGNSNKNIDESPVSPASFILSNIISVSSIDKNGIRSAFSNFGINSVDVTAPGEEIVTIAPDNQYVIASGTSMAAAFVSGEAAILYSQDPDASIQNIKEKIIKSSEHLSTLIERINEGNKISIENATKGIYPPSDQIIQIDGEDPEGEAGSESELMELFTSGTSQKSWYNTLVGPSVVNGISEEKYSAWDNLQEIVSMQTGDLTLKQSDITLSGRNGLNLEIGRIYQSNKSLFGERKIAGDNTTSYNDYSTYLLGRYGLGTGWGFTFPSVQVEEDEGETELYYHTGSGPVYHVEITVDPTDSNLEFYAKKDCVFEEDTTFTIDEITSKYVFKTADQTKRYFAEDGRLLAIVDRFGNQITFKHTEYPVTNYAPNNDFENAESQGIWTTNDYYSYSNEENTGKDDSTSLKFNSTSSSTQSSFSRYIPVLPNTKYSLNGYINNQLTSGSTSLTYREYDQDYNQLSQGTLSTATLNNSWEELSQIFNTSSTAAYLQIEFVNTNAVGTSYLDKVRFDRMWPLITEITDTIGRKITFAYTDTLYDESSTNAGTITVTVNDPTETDSVQFAYTKGKWVVEYNWSDWNEERRFPYLNKTEFDDNVTSYEYTEYDEKYSYTSKDTSGVYQNSKRPLLTELILRNSKVVYQYGMTTKHLGEYGFYETHRITNRSELFEYNTGYDTTQKYKQNYSYNGIYDSSNYDNETGYPGAYSLFEDPEYYFTTTMTQENGLTLKQTYKGKYEYKYEKQNDEGEEEITTNEQYDSQFPDMPTEVKIERTNSNGTNTLYKCYSYNNWGGKESETRALTQEQLNDSAVKEYNTIYYGYHYIFRFLESTRYYQNENKIIVELKSFDSEGRLVSKRNAKGETTQYQYEDSNFPGNLTKEIINHTGEKTTTTEFDYSGAYNSYPTTITKHYTEDDVDKTNVTHYTYEFIRGKVIEVKEDALEYEHKTSYSYDSLGRVANIIYPTSTGKDGQYVVKDYFEYDNYILEGHNEDYNNMSCFTVHYYKTKVPLGQTEGTVFYDTNTYYDDHGNLMFSQYYDYEEAEHVSSLNSFNNYGQVEYVEDEKGNQTIYDIDEWGRIVNVTDEDENQQVVNYDIYNLTRTTYFIPFGKTAENHYEEAYDQWGRVKSRKGYPDGINGQTVIEEKYEYDLAGNLVKLIDANDNVTNFKYDSLNRLERVINALGEVIDYEYDRLGNLSLVKQYEGSKSFAITKLYDERGALISKTPPEGNGESYEYNALGLPIEITDAMGSITTMQYYEDNRLKETRINQDKITYYYNPLGGVEKYEVWNDSTGFGDHLSYEYYSNGQIKQRKYSTFAVDFEYDLAGNKEKITDPFGLAVNYQYNSLNRPETLTVEGKTFTYEFYADGMIEYINYPNSLKTEYTYDNINRLKTLINKNGTQIISQYSYEYDNNGNIISINENGTITTYEYDALNRLIKIEKPNGEYLNYKYDTRGNRIQEEGISLIEDFIPGDLSYNSWEELETFTTNGTDYTYEYDPEGLRTKKAIPAGITCYHYDENGRVVAESDGTGQVTAQNIWGHKVLARKINGSYYYYLYNGHGDVIQVVNENGNIVNSYKYDEWGNILEKQEQIDNPIRYAGEYFDEESGLYYLRARYYDPVIGRFITKDSYEGDITNPLSLNLYTYCVNNPLKYVDPSGYFYIDEKQMSEWSKNGWKVEYHYEPGVIETIKLSKENHQTHYYIGDSDKAYQFQYSITERKDSDGKIKSTVDNKSEFENYNKEKIIKELTRHNTLSRMFNDERVLEILGIETNIFAKQTISSNVTDAGFDYIKRITKKNGKKFVKFLVRKAIPVMIKSNNIVSSINITRKGITHYQELQTIYDSYYLEELEKVNRFFPY